MLAKSLPPTGHLEEKSLRSSCGGIESDTNASVPSAAGRNVEEVASNPVPLPDGHFLENGEPADDEGFWPERQEGLMYDCLGTPEQEQDWAMDWPNWDSDSIMSYLNSVARFTEFDGDGFAPPTPKFKALLRGCDESISMIKAKGRLERWRGDRSRIVKLTWEYFFADGFDVTDTLLEDFGMIDYLWESDADMFRLSQCYEPARTFFREVKKQVIKRLTQECVATQIDEVLGNFTKDPDPEGSSLFKLTATEAPAEAPEALMITRRHVAKSALATPRSHTATKTAPIASTEPDSEMFEQIRFLQGAAAGEVKILGANERLFRKPMCHAEVHTGHATD
jgi:hypothetical protein